MKVIIDQDRCVASGQCVLTGYTHTAGLSEAEQMALEWTVPGVPVLLEVAGQPDVLVEPERGHVPGRQRALRGVRAQRAVHRPRRVAGGQQHAQRRPRADAVGDELGGEQSDVPLLREHERSGHARRCRGRARPATGAPGGREAPAPAPEVVTRAPRRSPRSPGP